MNYSIKTDTHTHTSACAHAYSTINENAACAAQKGLELIALTDHGPAMPDGPHYFHFMNLKALPRKIQGITILRGAEVNITDYEGGVDLDDAIISKLDWVIASAHEFCLTPASEKQHTEMWRAVAKNPLIDVIGHCGDERFKFDYEAVLPEFVSNGKLVEINSHSFVFRPGSGQNCRRIISILKELRAPIVVNSDAHFCEGIGCFDSALQALSEVGYPEELIVNRSEQSLLRFIKEKKGIEI